MRQEAAAERARTRDSVDLLPRPSRSVQCLTFARCVCVLCARVHFTHRLYEKSRVGDFRRGNRECISTEPEPLKCPASMHSNNNNNTKTKIQRITSVPHRKRRGPVPPYMKPAGVPFLSANAMRGLY